MKIKPPTEEDFSDKRLVRCFSVPFLKKLQLLSEEREKFGDYLRKTLDSLKDNEFKEVYLKKIKNKIIEKSKINESVFLMDRKGKGKELFYKKFKEGKRCLLCSKTVLDECHIVKNCFFKRKKRMKKHYRNFQNHLSNIIFLCPTDHRILDKSDDKSKIKMSNTKVRRIISRRVVLNEKMLRGIDKELKDIQKLNRFLDDFNKKIYKLINKELNILIKRL